VSTGTRRRIVVTLDSGELDTAELQRLVRLASRLDAELEGVFVEDSDVLRLAGFGFLQEYRPVSRSAEVFQAERMQQELRATAKRAERTLADYARRSGVHWQFRVWRGSLERELLAGLEADVLAMMRLGAVAIESRRAPRRSLVSACYDGSPEGERALQTAAWLAADSGEVTLQVLLAPASQADADALAGRAGRILDDSPVKVEYEVLAGPDLAALVEALRRSGSSGLVIQRNNRFLESASLRQSLAALHCPLFLVQ